MIDQVKINGICANCPHHQMTTYQYEEVDVWYCLITSNQRMANNETLHYDLVERPEHTRFWNGCPNIEKLKLLFKMNTI